MEQPNSELGHHVALLQTIADHLHDSKPNDDFTTYSKALEGMADEQTY